MNKSTPCIHKIFEVSSCHVTKEDDTLLKREDLASLSVYEVKGGGVLYGFLIYTGLEDSEQETLKGASNEGFSPAFVRLLDLALINKCKFLQLDCDGTEYDDLPKFDW